MQCIFLQHDSWNLTLNKNNELYVTQLFLFLTFFRFTVRSDPRWCCTYLLDATDPLFVEIGRAFITQQLAGIQASYLHIWACVGHLCLKWTKGNINWLTDYSDIYLFQNMEGPVTYITGKLQIRLKFACTCQGYFFRSHFLFPLIFCVSLL